MRKFAIDLLLHNLVIRIYVSIMKFVISLFLVSNYTFKEDCPHCLDKYLTLPWLIGTRHFPESKTRPRIQKHDPKYFREFKTLFKISWEFFRILGSAFGFWEVLWIPGSVFWLGTCHYFKSEPGKCFVPTRHHCLIRLSELSVRSAIRGRPFNSWGAGAGMGDFEKNFPASACRKKKLHAAQM